VIEHVKPYYEDEIIFPNKLSNLSEIRKSIAIQKMNSSINDIEGN
jgi:hypothetical protein